MTAMSGVPRLEDLGDVAGRTVLLRVDFNVPLDGDTIVDDFRIRSALPTISWLQQRGAKLVACSHLGRPNGRWDAALAMAPIRRRLAVLAPGVELLENLRFDPGETANEPGFVRRLVTGRDVYVNDAFSASHRSHASIVGPPAFLPSAAGRSLVQEVEALSALRDDPARPFVVVLGGAKVADKLDLARALLDVADKVLVGGAMCFTFLAALGHDLGASPVDTTMVRECGRLIDEAGDRLVLPIDLVALDAHGRLFHPEDGGGIELRWRDLPTGSIAADIGPATAVLFKDHIMTAKSVFWSGPLGAFEDPRFTAGTLRIAQCLASTRGRTVAGGGDTAAALDRFGLRKNVDYVSTGGGAALRLLESGDLPGLAALRAAPNARLLEGR